VTVNTSAQVLVVLSESHPAYEEVAQELRERLASADQRLRIEVIQTQDLASVDVSAFNAYKLVVTVGLSAAQVTVEREDAMPVAPLTLCLLISRPSFEELRPAKTVGRDRRRSAVFIDQPVARQLDLIRIALPERKRIGVILNRQATTLRRELLEEGQRRGLTLHIAEVRMIKPNLYDNSIYSALQSVIPESDVLLALRIPAIVDSGAIYDYMVTAYRAQRPVVGYAEGLVTAGALLALYSTPRQQARQGAEMAARVLAGDAELAAAQYPLYFTLRVNTTIARSMGLRLADETELAAALALRSEGGGSAQATDSIVKSAAQKSGQ
jgi:ABC-type uncharacterized transport system substrate-binding protein